MDCKYNIEHESAEKYVLGRLHADEKQLYEAHVRDCASCRVELDKQRTLISGVRAIGRDELHKELQRQIKRMQEDQKATDWTVLFKIAAVIFFFALLPGIVFYQFYLASPSLEKQTEYTRQLPEKVTAEREEAMERAKSLSPEITKKKDLSEKIDLLADRSRKTEGMSNIAGSGVIDEATPEDKMTLDEILERTAPPSTEGAGGGSIQSGGGLGAVQTTTVAESVFQLQAIEVGEHRLAGRGLVSVTQKEKAEEEIDLMLFKKPDESRIFTYQYDDLSFSESRDEKAGRRRIRAESRPVHQIKKDYYFSDGKKKITVSLQPADSSTPDETHVGWPERFAVNIGRRDSVQIYMIWFLFDHASRIDFSKTYLQEAGQDSLWIIFPENIRYRLFLGAPSSRAEFK